MFKKTDKFVSNICLSEWVTVGDFIFILVFDRISLIVFHVFLMSFLKR